MSKRSINTKICLLTTDYNELPESRTVKSLKINRVNENKSKEELIKEKLIEEKTITINKEPYLPNPKLVEAVNLAIALGRPLLLQGEPGSGKTRLAYAVAYALGLPLEVSYLKSTSRAQDLLYTYDAVNRLYDAQLKPQQQPKNNKNEQIDLDVKNYIHLGPLGQAIASASFGYRSVVLIDEIDKADLDFPNDLLWELDRLEFQVTEAPEIHYSVGDNPRPIIFVTHNEEKALPTAFLRRCIFHYVEFPKDELLLEILKKHQITDQELSKRAIDVLLRLRELDLSKRPGLSELLDWVGYLEAVNTPVEELDKLPYIGALLKQESDRQRAMEAFDQQ